MDGGLSTPHSASALLLYPTIAHITGFDTSSFLLVRRNLFFSLRNDSGKRLAYGPLKDLCRASDISSREASDVSDYRRLGLRVLFQGFKSGCICRTDKYAF